MLGPMTIRKIAQIGHPVLRQPARQISREELRSDDIQRFIDDLIETMRDANGAGLAATQIYEPVAICAVEVADNPRYPYKPSFPLTILVNPEITPIGDEAFANNEGCLSVPNLRGEVIRHARIRLKYLDREGNPVDREVAGVSAGTFQHEVDHLHGRLFVDRVTDPTTFSTWAEFQRHRQAEFAERVARLVEHYGS